RSRLDPLVIDECPFRERPRTNAPVRWVEPKLVCEVVFQEWTSDGRMRQPIFVGLREDKPARAVRREIPRPAEPVANSREGSSDSGPKLRNLEKVYWPADGYTKGDLIAYYREIADVIVPHLRNRPMSLHRHPDGIEGESFFQKDVSRRPPPSFVHTVVVPS